MTRATSCKEFALVENKNRKFRPGMEDTYCYKDKFNQNNSTGLFAVFDGHGGRHVADHCA